MEDQSERGGGMIVTMEEKTEVMEDKSEGGERMEEKNEEKGDQCEGDGDQYWLQLETPDERKARVRSLYIVHASALVFSLGFSIVLTGILPYLRHLTGMKDEDLLEIFGWMVAINPVGQMIFSPILGWLSNKLGSIRLVMYITCCVYIVGNLLYSCLSLLPEENEGKSRWLCMLAARLMVGISSANLAPSRSYIAGATFKHERTSHIAILSLCQALGFVIGPAIQAAVTPVGCDNSYQQGTISLDMYTIPGWISCVVGLISFVLFLPGIFQERYVSQKEAEHLAKVAGGQTEDIMAAKPDLLAILVCLFGFFIFMTNYILLETIGVPLCQQQLGWSEEESVQTLGILMSAGAVLSLVCFGSIGPLTRKFDERLVYLLLGILPMMLSRVAHIPMGSGFPPRKDPTPPTSAYPHPMSFLARSNEGCGGEGGGGGGGCDLEWCEYTPALTEFQFYLGYVIATISFPFCVGICPALFSKILGPRPQGTWMGLLTASGSLARILGPIAVSYVYEIKGTYWTFGICCGTMVLAGIATTAAFKRLIPMESRIAKRAEESSEKSHL